jgi:hypothetical protein
MKRPILRFVTETGSVYEIDETTKHIRRLLGNAAPTVRQGSDGEWKRYHSITNVMIGSNVLIVWRINREADAETVLCSTLTSKVKEVRHVEDML